MLLSSGDCCLTILVPRKMGRSSLAKIKVKIVTLFDIVHQ